MAGQPVESGQRAVGRLFIDRSVGLNVQWWASASAWFGRSVLWPVERSGGRSDGQAVGRSALANIDMTLMIDARAHLACCLLGEAVKTLVSTPLPHETSAIVTDL